MKSTEFVDVISFIVLLVVAVGAIDYSVFRNESAANGVIIMLLFGLFVFKARELREKYGRNRV